MLRRLFALIGSAMVAAIALRCSSFSSADSVEGGDEGSAEAALRGDAAEASALGSGRTGVACRGEGFRCDAGESCCNDGKGTSTCAVDCDAVDASFTIIECARRSDCPQGFDCCAAAQGYCGAGYFSGSRCVPAGTCKLCGDGGSGYLACDRLGSGDCPLGQTCSVEFPYTFYRVCTY